MAAGKSALFLLFLTVFIDLLGFGIIIPVMPKVASDFGASPETVAWLVMSYSAMQFLFTPFWGRLSDRIGRRPVLIISLGASCVGYLFWGLAASLPLLFVSRIVAGAGNANIAVAQAYITDITTPENRAKGMGLIGAAFGLGFTFGPAFGGLAYQFGFHAIGYLAAAASAVALAMALFVLPEPEKRSSFGTERFSLAPGFIGKTLSSKNLQGPLAIFLFSTMAFAGMEATLALFTFKFYNFTQADISWLFTFIGLVMVFVQGGLIGRLSKKVPEKGLIAAGTLLSAAGLACVALLKSVGGLYLASALLAIGTSLTTPSNQSLLSRLASEGEKGAVLGVGQSLSTAGRIVGPLLGGYLFGRVSPESPYYVCAALMLLVAMYAFTLPVLAKDEDAPSPEPARAKTA